MTDDRDRDGPPPSGPASARRRLSAATLPEVPFAKQAERSSATSPFAIGVGDPAPLFEPLAALRGRPVLVVFGPASEHGALALSLASAARELAASGASSLLVVAGDASLAARVAGPHGADVVVFADTTGAVHKAHGVLDPLTGRPRLAAFLVDPAGTVARSWTQPEPERLVRLALDALALAR